MSDSISRQDAIRLAEQGQIQGFEWQFKKLCELPSVEPETRLVAEITLNQEQIQSAVDNAVEKIMAEMEVPEIIRCKDCKNFRRWIDTDIIFCDLTDGRVSENDFCSWAERREDERNDI